MDIFLLAIVFIIGFAIALAATIVVFRLNKNSEAHGLSERLIQLTESHAISQTQITQQLQTQERALAKFLEEKLVMTAARVNETLEKNTNSQKSSLEELKERPVLNVLDLGDVATEKSKPLRTLIVLASTFFAFFLSGFAMYCYDGISIKKSK